MLLYLSKNQCKADDVCANLDIHDMKSDANFIQYK